MTSYIPKDLLSLWNHYGYYTAVILVTIGILILSGYLILLLARPDNKSRYDFINKNEVKLLWLSFVCIAVGITLLTNTLVDNTTWLWFCVRAFLISMMMMIVGVFARNVLQFYYPFFIEKRLKKLRYSPRFSPDGKKMKLLSEEEEDVYLDEGMQAEENAYSVDYDVWIEEVSGYIQIEKYNGRLHALVCPDCQYQTLKVSREEIIESATQENEGELMKFYTCTYCRHKTRKSQKIAKIKSQKLAETD